MARKVNLRLMIVAVLGFLSLSGLTLAVELYVPSEYGTIQAAIDDANDGDAVIVADGTYTGVGNKNLDFSGRAITVRSENGPEFTIIDCEGEGRGLYFHSTEDQNSVVDGFTITNGKAFSIDTIAEDGGGVLCFESSPKIVNCTFRNNDGPNNGGGVSLINSSALVSNCLFEKNQGGHHGGALSTSASSALIKDCQFIENSCYNFSADGGAILTSGNPGPTIFNLRFPIYTVEKHNFS